MNGWKRLIFEIAIIGALTLGGWIVAGLHNQVYNKMPESYVSKDRFNDVCNRLNRIEGKVDDINNYLRTHTP